MIAKKWLNVGSKLTAPTKRVELRCTGRGEKKRVVSTSAVGAMQVGYTADRLKNREGSPTSFAAVKYYRDNSSGEFWPQVAQLMSAYEERYGTLLEHDNDDFGREFVIERVGKL